MKKVAKISLALLFLAAIVPSCELLEDCATCKLITNNNGSITEGTGILYCGEALAEKENAAPVTIGNITTYYECY